MSEKARYFRDLEIKEGPKKIWNGNYDSGLEAYDNTFAGLGPKPISQMLQKRKSQGLHTVMYDIASSVALIKQLHQLKLISFGISFALVDSRRNPVSRIIDLLLDHSLIILGDIIQPSTFFGLPKANVITFRPVGAFDDYPEREFSSALINGAMCLSKNGVLFAQLPANVSSFENKGQRIISNLGLGRQWQTTICENSYNRTLQGFDPRGSLSKTHSVVKIERIQ